MHSICILGQSDTYVTPHSIVISCGKGNTLRKISSCVIFVYCAYFLFQAWNHLDCNSLVVIIPELHVPIPGLHIPDVSTETLCNTVQSVDLDYTYICILIFNT